MSDALTDALDSDQQYGAELYLDRFTLRIAREIDEYISNFRPWNQEKTREIIFKKIDYFIDNKELNRLYFTLAGGFPCGGDELRKGFKEYIAHANSCDKCKKHLSKHGLTPESVHEKIESIIAGSPQYV